MAARTGVPGTAHIPPADANTSVGRLESNARAPQRAPPNQVPAQITQARAAGHPPTPARPPAPARQPPQASNVLQVETFGAELPDGNSSTAQREIKSAESAKGGSNANNGSLVAIQPVVVSLGAQVML